MKKNEFKKCPDKDFIWESINPFMENHEFIWKKHMISGVPRSVSSNNSHIWIHIRIRIHICEFICEFMYENKIYEFIYEFIYELIYVIITNKHNMAISMFKIWWSGCSRSKWCRRLRLWCSGGGESLSQWSRQRQLTARDRGAFGMRRAAASDSGLGDWGGLLRVTAGCCKWLTWRPGSCGRRRARLGRGRWRRAQAATSD